MQFAIHKNYNDTWSIAPVEGRLAGTTVATAEGLNVSGVRFNGRQMIGVIKAAWGLSVMYDELDIDTQTLRGLCIGKCFDMRANERVRGDSDGFKEPLSLRLLKGARSVVALGSSIRSKGQY